MKSRLTSAMQQYARNLRWGTCSGCPRLGDGTVAPELCQFADRYDHQLTAADLAFQLHVEHEERKQ